MWDPQHNSSHQGLDISSMRLDICGWLIAKNFAGTNFGTNLRNELPL